MNINDDSRIGNYFKDIRRTSLITPEEEVELAIRIKGGDQRAINKLVESNLKFVISIAKEYQGQGLTLGDLINEGNLGLVKAATRFDHTRGFRFISYAVWWVKQSIKQSLNDNSRTIRLPSNVINKLTVSKREYDKFEFENEREATYADFLDDDNVLDISRLPKCGSLNEMVNEDGNELQQLIEDKSIPVDDAFLDNTTMIKNELDVMLNTLSDREKEIIECYYGVNKNFEHMSLEVIGEKYDLTKERIRQIKEKALRKLRHNAHNLFDILND
jgi:RNA polymerase primary sigma factor